MDKSKKITIIDTIKDRTRVLNAIVLLIIFTLLFVNIRVIYSILDYIPLYSTAIMLSIVTGLVLIGLYLSRKISLDAINKLIEEINKRKAAEVELRKANEDLENRVEARTVKLTRTLKILGESLVEHQKQEKKLYDMSITDELTGVLNRRGFFTLTEHRLKIAKREKTGLLLLYADLDNLKEINDRFGHEEGDKLLKETANILKSTYRDADIVARIGGDEFVVFPVGTTMDHVEMITTRLQKEIDNYNADSKSSYKLSVSIGIATYDPESVNTIDGLLAEADRLMYEQKIRKGP